MKSWMNIGNSVIKMTKDEMKMGKGVKKVVNGEKNEAIVGK